MTNESMIMADQDRYSRQDLAEMFRRCTSTIDKWRKRGLVPKPHRTLREPWWTDKQVEEIRRNVGICCNSSESVGIE
jgi:hypothetical protein